MGIYCNIDSAIAVRYLASAEEFYLVQCSSVNRPGLSLLDPVYYFHLYATTISNYPSPLKLTHIILPRIPLNQTP